MDEVLTYEKLKEKRLMMPMGDLYVWDENPKTITGEEFEKLVRKLKNVQFSPLLVVPDDQGKAVIIGGNSSYKAMGVNGYTEAWVSIIDFKTEGEVVTAYINGVRDFTFQTKRDGMMHYALTHNEHNGRYDQIALQQITLESNLDLENYEVYLGEPVTLDRINEIHEEVEESLDSVVEKKEREKKDLICPQCGYKIR